MQQQQFQKQKSKTPLAPLPQHPSLAVRLYWVRFTLFILVIFCTAIFSSFALLIGLLFWWLASRVADRQEYWRGLWSFALFCALIYIVWIVLANPLPFLWGTFHLDLAQHFWRLAVQSGLALWLFNAWLAPLIAPILAGLSPNTLTRQIEAAHPKSGTIQDEREAQTRQTRQLGRLQDMLSARQKPAFPAPVTPVREQKRRDYPLGLYKRGELIQHVEAGSYRLPASFFDVHGVIIGEPKTGKSTSLIKLASIARAYGRRVIYLDLKGSHRTAALFVSAMSLLGCQSLRLYPAQAYNGWRGDAQALYNRLMQQIDPSSHPFYRSGVGSTIVALACKAPPGPPRNSLDFMRRLDYDWLKSHYSFDGQALREIDALSPHIGGLALVFAGFFRGLAGGLDGEWAYEDADASYIGVNSIAHREEAAALARYLLDDAAHFSTVRKDPHEKVLLIIDEFGALNSTNATTLYEQVRESGLCVYASGQSYKSLGIERDNILEASPIKIVHRTGSPEPLIKYAGKREVFKFSVALDKDQGEPEDLYHPYANKPDSTGGYLRSQDEYAIPIEDVQQLDTGHVVLIDGGQHAYIQVQPLEIPSPLVTAAQDAILQAGHYKPLPPLPPAPRKENEKKKQKRAERKPANDRPQLAPPTLPVRPAPNNEPTPSEPVEPLSTQESLGSVRLPSISDQNLTRSTKPERVQTNETKKVGETPDFFQ